MAAEEFVRVPPDSTGKRILAEPHSFLYYNNGTIPFDTDQIVVGTVSGASGRILKVEGDTISGVLYILKDDEDVSFVSTDNLEVSSIKYAEVQLVDAEIRTQIVSVGGGNNPHNQAFVDDNGNLQVRYGEGIQQLDAAGITRTSSPSILGEYLSSYDDQGENFTTETGGSGTQSYLTNENAVEIIVGTSGSDFVYRTTDKYHLYQPGFGQLIMMTVMAGDTGKTNNTRRWGYFDGYNGLYFELDGTTLNACVRTNVTGSVVDTKVAQTSWNGDIVDGSGGTMNLSKINLDISKVNIYWIDFLWLGSGRARFGIFNPDGSRVTVHTFEHSNTLTAPFMSSPALPVRFENFNSGSTASSSSLKTVCASVMTDGNLLEARRRSSKKHTGISDLKTVYDGYYTPIISFRSAQQFKSKTNRLMSLPEFFSFRVKDNDIHLKIVKNPTLSGESWVNHTDSALDIDGYATGFSGGHDLLGWILDPGVTQMDAPKNFDYYSEHATLRADGNYGDVYTVVGTCLESGQTARAQMQVTWIDIG